MQQRGSTTVKVILGIALGLVLCVALAVYVWWHNTGSAMYDAVAGNMQEGRRIGMAISASGCVDTTVARHIVTVAARPKASDSTPPDLKALMGEPIFFGGCLSAAKPSPELCAAVPPQTDPKRGREWAKEQCEQRHASDTGCPALLLGPLQAYCGRAGRTTGLSS